MTAREIAERGTIIRATVGSTAHGVHVGTTDDRDEMGVCIEPAAYVIGLDKFEHYVYRTQPEGRRSGPGDLDLTIYSLRKWARLALRGNPTVLLLLFVPDAECAILTPEGEAVRAAAPSIVSRKAGRAFLGYMEAQRQRLAGERGQKNVKRPELLEQYGYDTKYAGHIIRLGYQGIELMETGRITLPMRGGERDDVLAVRRGEWELNRVLSYAGEMVRTLEDLLDNSPLPPEPDRQAVNQLLIDIYSDRWNDPAWQAAIEEAIA